jgi:excisionase family DNA binding protein
MSRPTLVSLLKEGRIAHRMVGSHRRVSRASLLAFRESRDAGQEPDRNRAERMAEVSDFLAEWSEAEERPSS